MKSSDCAAFSGYCLSKIHYMATHPAVLSCNLIGSSGETARSCPMDSADERNRKCTPTKIGLKSSEDSYSVEVSGNVFDKTPERLFFGRFLRNLKINRNPCESIWISFMKIIFFENCRRILGISSLWPLINYSSTELLMSYRKISAQLLGRDLASSVRSSKLQA